MLRRRFEDPGSFLPKLLEKDSVIADVGCGGGFYCRHLADYSSMLYCIDIDERALGAADGILRKTGKTKYVLLTSMSSIMPHSVDVVLFANSFHDMEDKKGMHDNAVRILKKGGRIIIVDWRKDDAHMPGPPAQIRMDESDYLKYFKEFRVAERFDPGKHHFGLLLVPA